MNNITFTILMFFVFIFCDKAKSQYSIAGNPGTNYFDVIPDTLVSTNANYQYVNYYIDINQDGVDDIQIQTYHAQSPASHSANTRVFALNNSTRLIGDTVSNYIILKMYNLNDSININDTVSNGYLSYYSSLAGQYLYYNNSWSNVGDKYFGIRYQDVSGVRFGWVKVNLTNYTECFVKEYSLGYLTCNMSTNANFTANIVCEGLPTSFIDSSTSIGNSSIVSWSWDFNTDGIIDDILQNPSYNFLNGNHLVTLITTTSYGCNDSTVKGIYVHPIPNSDFSYSPQNICAGDVITFVPNSIDTNTNYSWDFNNDGVPESTSQNSTFLFDSIGSYSISLSVVKNSCIESTIKNIVISCINNIRELNISDFFTLYPNPSSSCQFTVVVRNKINKNYQLSITNLLGDVLQNMKITDDKTQINVNGFPKGVYYVILKGHDLLEVKKIILQ